MAEKLQDTKLPIPGESLTSGSKCNDAPHQRGSCEQCSILEKKLTLLSEENDLLSDRAEEILLLGLIGEKIAKLDGFEKIVYTGLEQIAILNNISFAAWCSLDENEATIVRSYSLLSHDEIMGRFLIDPSTLIELENDTVCLSDNQCRAIDIETDSDIDLHPLSISIVPFLIRNSAKHIMVLIDTDNANRLKMKTPLLNRAVDMLVSHQDNQLLLEELRDLNTVLDKKVADRTNNLEELNRDLQREISEKADLVSALNSSKENFRALIENAADAIFVIREDMSFIDVNKEACSSLGYSREELLAMNVPEISKHFDLSTGKKIFNNLSGSLTETLEEFHIRKDGSSLPVEVHVSAMALDGEKLLLALARDITERKSLEEQLNQAQKMEAVGRLAGGVAHDFNNILSTILGYSDMALMDLQEGDPLFLEMKSIRLAGKKAADLTRQLLSFSRKDTISIKVMNWNDVVEGFVKMIGRLIGEDIKISLDLAEDLGNIRGDAGKLEQILMNLAVNARDAMPDGGEITLSTKTANLPEELIKDAVETENHTGRYAVLEFTDNGTGIPKSLTTKIFEPFYTTKEATLGTGLGLATVYGIVHQHQGQITVNSSPGQGATFRIYLPEVSVPVKEDTVASPQSPVEGNETILIVEDDQMTRQMLQNALTHLGYTVLVAENGHEAIKIFKEYQGTINLVVTDVVMPEMNGHELVLELQKNIPNLKNIYMSGYTADIIRKYGIIESDINFIEKPIVYQKFSNMIRSLLDKS